MICVTVSKDGEILRSYSIHSEFSEDVDLPGLLLMLDEAFVGCRVVKNGVFTAGAFDGERVAMENCNV